MGVDYGLDATILWIKFNLHQLYYAVVITICQGHIDDIFNIFQQCARQRDKPTFCVFPVDISVKYTKCRGQAKT